MSSKNMEPCLSVVLPGKVWVGQPCRRNYADCGSRCELSASCPCHHASPAMMDSPSGAKAKRDSSFHKWLWSQLFITATDTHGFQGSHSALDFVKGFALNSQQHLSWPQICSHSIEPELSHHRVEGQNQLQQVTLCLYTCAVAYLSPHRHKSINERKKHFNSQQSFCLDSPNC